MTSPGSKLTRWSRRAAIVALPVAMLMGLVAPAQAAWPEQPVKITLPFGTGGV